MSTMLYGRLLILSRFKRDYDNKCVAICIKCRVSKEYFYSNLKRGKTKSCGCLHKEWIKNVKTIHGETKKTPEYRTWMAMTERCRDKNSSHYKYYGGRGIKVCKRWLGKFGYINFLKDMGRRPKNMYQRQWSIDRINVDRGYSPDNCRWATQKVQQNNKHHGNQYKPHYV